jgi:hypothetical protein
MSLVEKKVVRFGVFTAVTMASSVVLRHVALVKTDVSEELRASIIRVIRIECCGLDWSGPG